MIAYFYFNENLVAADFDIDSNFITRADGTELRFRLRSFSVFFFPGRSCSARALCEW